MKSLERLAAADPELLRRGKHFSAGIQIDIGSNVYLIRVAEGRVVRVVERPLPTVASTFRLSASEDAWQRFLQPVPPPGFNDIFALLHNGQLDLSGDMRAFMANLFFLKRLLELLRSPREVAA